MQHKTTFKQALVRTRDPYGPQEAALRLKETLENIILTLDQSDNLDRKQLKEKFKSYISKSEVVPSIAKFSTLIKKKSSLSDNIDSHPPQSLNKNSLHGNHLMNPQGLEVLSGNDMFQGHTENKKILLKKETVQLKKVGDLSNLKQYFNVPPPPPNFKWLNTSKIDKPKDSTLCLTNKTSFKKKINLPCKPIKGHEERTKLNANIDTIEETFLAEKQTSKERLNKNVFLERSPQTLNESPKKKNLHSSKKKASKKNVSKSESTIKKKKNVSISVKEGEVHSQKKNSQAFKNPVDSLLKVQVNDHLHSDTSSNASDTTSDKQEDASYYKDIVVKRPKKVPVKKKILVEKNQFQRLKNKTELERIVLENKIPQPFNEKKKNKKGFNKKNISTRRNSLNNSLSGDNTIQNRHIVNIKKDHLLHESDTNSLSHNSQNVQILRAMECDQKSVSSHSLDEMFPTRASKKCYEQNDFIKKKTNITFLNCLSGISTHFSEEAQQMSASEESLTIEKKALTPVEEPYKRRTSRNICFTRMNGTEHASRSVFKIPDTINSQDDSKNLREANKNIVDRPIISLKKNILSQKLAKKQQAIGYASSKKEEEHGNKIADISKNNIYNESDFLKRNMSLENLHFYESLVQNYDPSKDLWTLKDAFQNIHGPFSATQLVYWIRQELIQRHSDLQFCREAKKEYLSLKEALPYLTGAQILYDNQRLSCTIQSQSNKNRLPENFVDAEKICVQYHVDENGSFLRGLQTQWKRKRNECFPDTQVVLLPMNSTNTTKTNFFNGKIPLASALDTAEETMDYLDESQDGFVDWAQTNNIDLPDKTYLLPMNSTVLKFASPIFEAVLEKQEKRRLEGEKTRRNSDFMYTLGIACMNPEATQLLFRALYQSSNVFDSCEPILVLCAYHEAARFSIESLQNQLVKCLLSVRNIEVLIILSSMAESLQHWYLLAHLALMLCNCAYSVFSNENYLKLGPLTLRFILGSKLCGLDEIQLLVAVYKWIEKWKNHKSFITQNFYKTFHLFETQLRRIENSADFSFNDDEFLESTHMSPIEIHSLNKIFFYSSLRLCQMSPKELNECRYLIQLDTLLLDAFLRKTLHKEMPRRALPWNNSHHFILNYKNGLFPVSLTRVQPRNLPYVNISEFKKLNFTQGDLPNQVIPPYYKSTDKFWVSAFGDFRMVTQACWGIQVSNTKEGSISVGAVSEELSNLLPAGIPTSPTGRIIWYFNCLTRQFYTALMNLGTRKVTCRLAMTPYLSETTRETVSTGCVIVVHYSVGVRNVWMTVALHNPHDPIAYYRASFNFLHQIKPVKYDELSHRYMLSLAPWNELKDYNDTLEVPDITIDPVI